MCPRGRPRGQGRPRRLHLWWILKVIADSLTAKYPSNLLLSAGNIAKFSFEDQYCLNGNSNGLTACRCLAPF